MISIRVRGPIRSSRRRIMPGLDGDAALGGRKAGPRQMQEDGAAAAAHHRSAIPRDIDTTS